MLAHGPQILLDARAEARAVPAFTTYTLESTRAICEAAERTGLPVIISAGSSSFRGSSRAMLAAAAVAAAREASVPVGVHLDHSTDLDEIRACLELGYTSVMLDGSHLPLEDNVTLTRTVVAEAHAAGVWVEAELGGVTGAEDASTGAVAGELTDPDLAAEFAERTGIDALAAAVGTVHGFTTVPVHVDLDRVRTISTRTGIPFVLHGASGLPDAELAAAVGAGVAKVNVNAELRRAYLAALDGDGSDDITRLQARLVDAMARVATEKLALLSGRSAETMTTRET
jgi:ketose-bisphosphate aldolase